MQQVFSIETPGERNELLVVQMFIEFPYTYHKDILLTCAVSIAEVAIELAVLFGPGHIITSACLSAIVCTIR